MGSGNIIGGIIGATVTLVALYLFLANGDESSKVIRSIASAYSEAVETLQGRPAQLRSR